MSTKVNLEFQTKIDLDFLTENVAIKLVRLLGTIHLKSDQEWSLEEKVIIDTGNPITIIPYSVWQAIDKKVLTKSKTKLYGLNSSEESALSGKLAEFFLTHKHDLMHKATGWMLREIGKKELTVLIDFLDKHYKKMPRTMLRYAIEKLDKPKRRHYLGK